MKAAVIVAILAISCGPRTASHVAPEPPRTVPAQSPNDAAVSDIGGISYGGATYGGPPPQGGALVWTVKVTDHATGAPLVKVPVTAIEQTWDCKTREIPEPPDPNRDHRHRPPRIEQYDCKGGKNHITQQTDARGMTIFKLPHAQYELGPVKQPGYLASDFPDPVYQRIVGGLVTTAVTNGGATRLTEFRLFPESALKVKTDAQAETLALQNPIVQKCMAAHPQLTHQVKKPSLLWRVQFLYAGANNMELEATVDSISSEVGFLGCWDPCCAVKVPSRFEKRLANCPKLRATNDPMQRNWDCDTIDADYVKLHEFLGKQGDLAEQKRYDDLYRAFKAAGN